MLKFLGVLLIFQSLNTQSVGLYVFIDEQLSWEKAFDKCHREFNGAIPVLPFYDSGDLTDCIHNKKIWTGHYSEISKWMSLEGCYRLPDSQSTYEMTEASAQACLKYCSSMDSNTFAVSGNRCACNIQLDNQMRINDSECTEMCDDKAFCGGSNSYTGYHTDITVNNESDDKQCSMFRCTSSGGLNMVARPCSNKQTVICADNTTLNGRFDWSSGTLECLSLHQRFIVSIKHTNQCYNQLKGKTYWNSIFRTERFREDSVNSLPGWDHPDPLQAVYTDTEFYEHVDKAEEKYSTLCETDDGSLDLSEYCVAQSSPATPPVTTMTSMFVTTSSDVISKTSGIRSSTEYSSTSTTIKASSTEDSRPPEKTSSQQQASSGLNTSIIGGLTGGIAITITVVIIGIFVWYKRKRKSPGKEFDDKKSVSNPGYEAPVIPGGNVNNYYNIQNTHNDDINPPADDYFILEKPNDAAAKNLKNEDDGGDYFNLEKSTASEENADDTNGQYSNIAAQRGDNPNCTPTTNRQDEDDTYARSAEGDYDHLNNSQARRNVTMDTDEMYAHAKPSHNEESEYDKVGNLEEEITPYGYASVGENSTYDRAHH